tara:strand:+ start:235 stop:354 length:120 start_codon:yes stop_codon:yes gene_type:complete
MKDTNNQIFQKAIGRPAMLGFILILGVYSATGQIIPGIV